MWARGSRSKREQALPSTDRLRSKLRFLSERQHHFGENGYIRPDESPLGIRSIPSGRGYCLYSLREVFTVSFFDAAKFTTTDSLAGEMFQEQSRTLIARPSLALHVRHIPSYLWSPSFLLKPASRTLSMHMFGSNAPILVKLLTLLPNLETLEVLAEDFEEPDFDISFKRVTLPQTRKLLVSTDTVCHEVLP